nr:MAG TPA: hypothetical protein [Caudoviricetes sp.]
MRVIAQRGAEDLGRFLPGGGGHAGIAAEGDAVAVVGDAGSARHSARRRRSSQQADDLGTGIRQCFPAALAPGSVALGPAKGGGIDHAGSPAAQHPEGRFRHCAARRRVLVIGAVEHGASLCCDGSGGQECKRDFGAVGVQAGGGVRQCPAHAHDHAQGHHILLGEVVNDLLGGGVLNNALIQQLHGDVLTDGVHQLLEVARDQLGLGSIKAAVLREVHRCTVQRVGGGTLHVGTEQGTARGIHKAAQLCLGGQVAHHGVHAEAASLHLGEQAVLAQQLCVVDGAGHLVLGRKGQHVGRPLSGALAAEQDGVVDLCAHGFPDAGLYLAHDVKAGICQHSFGHGHDDSQLCSGHVHVVPFLLAGLFHAGVTVDPVSQRQHGQHGDLGLVRGHVCKAGAQLHHDGALGHILLDGVHKLLPDQGLSLIAGDCINSHKNQPFWPNAARNAAFAASCPFAGWRVPPGADVENCTMPPSGRMALGSAALKVLT